MECRRRQISFDSSRRIANDDTVLIAVSSSSESCCWSCCTLRSLLNAAACWGLRTRAHADASSTPPYPTPPTIHKSPHHTQAASPKPENIQNICGTQASVVQTTVANHIFHHFSYILQEEKKLIGCNNQKGNGKKAPFKMLTTSSEG